jgi:hypothetical protein
MKNQSKIFGILLLSGLIFQGCKHDDDHDHNHEGELITTLKFHLVPPGGGMVMATWKDLTPNEPSGVTVDTLKLDSGLTYSGRVELLDETVSPSKDRTAEIKKEGDEHLFVFKQNPASPALLNLGITDTDSKGRPIGITFNLSALQKGTAKLRVVLRHQPGSKDGTEAPGDTDVDVEIPFVVK